MKAKTTKNGNVKLVLSREEADVLACIYGHIGGSPLVSPRKHQQTVLQGLCSIGIDWCNHNDHLVAGSIVFADYPVTEDKGN